MKVSEIVKITGGKLISGDPDIDIDLSKVSSDSRTIAKGEFFLALNGANFNGSNFVEDALKKGAIGALTVKGGKKVEGSDKPIIEVEDTLKALQDIAAAHRRKFDIPVICITGSNGKTTVKDMIWAVLSTKYNVLRNEGTKNNHIGVPQTLLKLNKGHDICVLELGANHRGEISLLGNIARPTIAVITNIGPSHLEFFGDLKGVYEAKKEILDFLDRKGTVIFNWDDKFLSKLASKGLNIKKFGIERPCGFKGKLLSVEKNNIKFSVNNKFRYELNLLGVHNVYNALAAIAVASEFNIAHAEAGKALSCYRPTCMRLDLKSIGGINFINDSYNSNPLSMAGALEAIKFYPARAKWIVSGDMLELGRQAADFHRKVGERIAKADIDGLLTFGDLSRNTHLRARTIGMPKDRLWHCSTHDEIVDVLKRVVKKGDLVLLKGSRSMSMEKVMSKLEEAKGK